ncbi:MAG: DUF3443 family protein, partial [Burkholderiales bacterium]
MNKRHLALIAALAISASLSGCGGDGSSSSTTATTPIDASQLAGNQIAVTVDWGPVGVRTLNELFASVTICAPGTSNCQTIDHVMVDTASSGLRIIASVLDPRLLGALPQSYDQSGNPFGECIQFVNGFSWGPIRHADIKLAGEAAPNALIQVIGESDFSAIPIACGNTGPAENTVQSLGANGVLGISVFAQDCGQACVSQSNLGMYYVCASRTCSSVSASLAQQLWNPVALFATDNNGSSVTLPAVSSGGAVTLTGILTFGVATQANNGLGTAAILTVDPTFGE